MLKYQLDAGLGAGERPLAPEHVMFFWFLMAVGAVVVLTLVGALVSRRAPGTAWEEHEDRPIGPGMDL